MLKPSITSQNIIIRSINELKNSYLNKNKEYYINKKFACIKILFNNKNIEKLNNFDDLNDLNYKNMNIITINIHMYIINQLGEINQLKKDNWETNINISVNDLMSFKPKLKTIEVLARIISEKYDIKKNINYYELF